MSKTVLVIGTGTIGEPLIGLLARLKVELGIDRVIFHKRTPLDYEVALSLIHISEPTRPY